MRVVADTHVHLYPLYNVEAFVTRAARNLACLVDTNKRHIPTALVLCLTDIEGKDSIPDLMKLRAKKSPKFQVEAIVDDHTCRIEIEGYPSLFVLPGQQIRTRKRLEVLVLASAKKYKDGMDVRETIQLVQDAGDLPILPWAPGKWMFERGKTIRDIIETTEADAIAVADTAMRPTLTPTPYLLRQAVRRKHRCLAGTDPLPLKGEEERVGLYGTVMEGDFELGQPCASFRKLLMEQKNSARIAGRRLSPASVMRRLLALKV